MGGTKKIGQCKHGLSEEMNKNTVAQIIEYIFNLKISPDVKLKASWFEMIQ